MPSAIHRSGRISTETASEVVALRTRPSRTHALTSQTDAQQRSAAEAMLLTDERASLGQTSWAASPQPPPASPEDCCPWRPEVHSAPRGADTCWPLGGPHEWGALSAPWLRMRLPGGWLTSLPRAHLWLHSPEPPDPEPPEVAGAWGCDGSSECFPGPEADPALCLRGPRLGGAPSIRLSPLSTRCARCCPLLPLLHVLTAVFGFRCQSRSDINAGFHLSCKTRKPLVLPASGLVTNLKKTSICFM